MSPDISDLERLEKELSMFEFEYKLELKITNFLAYHKKLHKETSDVLKIKIKETKDKIRLKKEMVKITEPDLVDGDGERK